MYLSSINNEFSSEKAVYEKSALELAFVGDAVWELLIREVVANRDIRPNEFHKEAVAKVNAKAQSEYLGFIANSLTEREMSVVKRGRNSNRRTPPRGANPEEYRNSTAFEALFGYLWLIGRLDRILELFNIVLEYIDF